tara:strand:+ start:700 stop:924 length:225 start_codon:yes stop_codon:yes gene_type:complete
MAKLKKKKSKNIKPFDEQNTKLAQGFVKRVGEPISLREATDALHIIKKTSGGNPLQEELRRKRLFRSNPIDVNM